jgi:hypothetical protein
MLIGRLRVKISWMPRLNDRSESQVIKRAIGFEISVRAPLNTRTD